jgi:dihydrofolate reductase
MGELFLQISVSLDGFIEDRDHDLDWMVNDASLDPLSTATLEEIDGMIFGRTAHRVLAGFWPGAADQPDASGELVKQAALMRDLPKYVLTHGKETHGWENSHPISVDGVKALKAEAKRPIAVFAGAGAAQALLHLTDEVRLIQYPVLLGSGTRLFDKPGPRRSMHRIETREFPSGALLTRDRFD